MTLGLRPRLGPHLLEDLLGQLLAPPWGARLRDPTWGPALETPLWGTTSGALLLDTGVYPL
jgi:hypothetical protein